jgi:Rad3-related DNA helicase
MIPKVPYPDLGDDIVRLRYDYVTDEGESIGKQVYQQEAVKTLVQAAGRCVRTLTSKGVTVITDGAFWPLYKYAAPDAFPDWFRAAVSWYKPKESRGG